MENKKLSETLSYEKKSVYELAEKSTIAAATEYAENYKKYLDDGKTERESVKASIAIAEKYGFTEYKLGDAIKQGDKKYYNNRGKNLFVFSVGSESINIRNFRFEGHFRNFFYQFQCNLLYNSVHRDFSFC